MSSQKFFMVGPVVICVENCASRDYNFFIEFFQGVKIEKTPNTADVIVKVVNHCDLNEYKYHSSRIQLSENSFYKIEDNFAFSVENLFNDAPVIIKIYPKVNPKELKYKMYNLTYILTRCKTLEEKIIEEFFSYKVFWSIFSLVLLKKDMVFIHGGCLDFDGEGILFAGTGGCGKTSTSFKVLEDKRYKYLSEDFGIIDKYGNMYFSPKWMAIYNSDINYGQADLVNYKNKMRKYKKLLWNIMEIININPMARVSPLEILGVVRTKEKTRIQKVYFFVRVKSNNIIKETLSNEDFVDRALNASFRELKPLYEILIHPQCILPDSNNKFPTLNEIKEEYTKIYRSCFNGLTTNLCFLPIKVNPIKIIDKLEMDYEVE